MRPIAKLAIAGVALVLAAILVRGPVTALYYGELAERVPVPDGGTLQRSWGDRTCYGLVVAEGCRPWSGNAIWRYPASANATALLAEALARLQEEGWSARASPRNASYLNPEMDGRWTEASWSIDATKGDRSLRMDLGRAGPDAHCWWHDISSPDQVRCLYVQVGAVR